MKPIATYSIHLTETHCVIYRRKGAGKDKAVTTKRAGSSVQALKEAVKEARMIRRGRNW